MKEEVIDDGIELTFRQLFFSLLHKPSKQGIRSGSCGWITSYAFFTLGKEKYEADGVRFSGNFPFTS
jgi:hypothetical protein